MNINSKFFLAVLATAMLGACTDETQQASEPKQKTPAEVVQPAPTSVEPAQGPGDVFVHLFEWRWPDIAPGTRYRTAVVGSLSTGQLQD